MDAVLTVKDLLTLALYLLGIGVLFYLVLILKNAYQTIKSFRVVFDENQANIDNTLKHLPDITNHISSITESTDVMLKDITPEVNNLVHNVSNITGRVDSIADSLSNTTNKVYETVDLVGDSISETAYAFQYNVKNVDNYIKIIIETIETIKSVLKKK